MAVVLAIFLACVYYYRWNPEGGAAPRCVFKVLSGWDCPGCGSQRAFHALLHGDVAGAWACNPFVFFAIPLALLYLICERRPDSMPRLHRVLVHPAAPIIITLAIVAWWILRNIPAV